MSKVGLALFLVISVCGCAAIPPKIDQKNGLAQVREALGNYNDCLKQNIEPYLMTKIKPKIIADAVANKCEPKLNDYKLAVRKVFAEGLNPEMDGYSDFLLSKPEAHANRIREKGKSAMIARVLNVRK